MANKFTVGTVFAAFDQMTKPITAMTKSVDGLAKSTDRAKAVVGKIGQAGAVVAKGVLGIAGVATAAGAAVFGLATKASKAADSVVDTANAIGISTRALQEYRYVAALSGMETADMDAALTKLTVNLGKGGKEMDAVLAMLGLSAEQLKSAGPDQVLELIADGMKNVADPTARAAITTQLFGKSSVRMVNALSGGAEGLRALRQEAEDVGYVMDDLSLKAGTEMGDSFDRLKAAGTGLFNSIGARFFPMVTKAIDGITRFMVKNRTMLDGFLGGLGRVFESLGPIVAKVGPLVVQALDKLLPVFTKLLEAAMPVIEQILDGFVQIMPAVLQLAEAVSKVLVPVFNLLKPILDLILPVIIKITEGIAALADLIARVLGPVIDFLAGAVDKFGKGMRTEIAAQAGAPSGLMGSMAAAAMNAPAAAPVAAAPLSTQTSTINRNTTSRVDVNFNNPPSGTKITTSGAAAPPVTLNVGSQSMRGVR